MRKTVVILLSDKRSGSTMFQEQLCLHPDIQTVSYSPHTYLETHHWLKAAVMLDVDKSLFSGGKRYNGYGKKQNARIYMKDCILKNVPDFVIPTTDHELVFQGWEVLCHHFAQPVFFEKSPQFLAHWGCLELILEWIKRTEFQVKVIGLVRNPLSVLYSAQKLFYTEPAKRQYGWLEIYRNLERFTSYLAPEQYMLCRYEDIIKDPATAFESICEFVGVPSYVEVGSGVHASSVNKWLLDPFFTIRIDDTVRTMAKQFGYADHELNNPGKNIPQLFNRIKKKAESTLKRLFSRVRNQLILPISLGASQNLK